jgi:hypothetical protein
MDGAVRLSVRAAPAKNASRIASRNPVTGSCPDRPDPELDVPSAFDILIKPVRLKPVRRAGKPSRYRAIGDMGG